MVQEVSNRLCRDVQGRSCVRGEDVPEEMGSNADRVACSCGEGQAMEKKTQQLSNILCIEVAKTPIWGCRPLKKVRFSDQIICFVTKRFRTYNGDAPPMGRLKHFGNLFEMAHRHLADEKELPLTFMLVSFGQELLDENSHFAARWLLVLHFIHHDGLKTGATYLKQFAHAAPISQGQRRQSGSKKRPSVERFRIKEDGS